MWLAAIVTPEPAVGGLTSAVQSLPVAAHVLAGSALAAGLVLWCLGRRVVKPVFVLIGALLGAGSGFLLAPLTGIGEIGSVPTPYIGLGIGALLGGTIGVLLFRFAVAVSTGAVLGLAGVLISLILMTAPEQRADAQTAVESAAERAMIPPEDQPQNPTPPLPDGVAPREFIDGPILSPEAKEQARKAAERVRAFLAALGEELRPRWEALPERSRLTIIAAGLGGLVGGFLLGLVMPQRSSAAVTALFGAAVWLPSAVWLVHATDAPGQRLLQHGPLAWTIVWSVVAALGFAVQLAGLKKPKKAEKD